MRYSEEQIHRALKLYRATGSPGKVISTLGYPSPQMLYKWLKKYPVSRRRYKHASKELKLKTIQRCFINGEDVKLVSDEIGYTVGTIYLWRRRYQPKGAGSPMEKHDIDNSQSSAADEIKALKAQILELQMDVDILNETIKVLKKDPGFDRTALRNREKAVIVDALRDKYSLPKLCRRIDLPRSCYYYQMAAIGAVDKYAGLREEICSLFADNRSCFGYRRIHTLLSDGGTKVSGKVVRRIMKQEGLSVKTKRRRKYSSYKGEISPAVDNVIDRDFHAEKPNLKWLTDITEFSIDAGKVYLSPVLDCFDGLPVSWTIGVHPDAELVNSMIRKAISTLKPGERPVIHSDRGCHYRWPEWINIVEGAGLTRSMSRKGCSPDNSACEGFFGHLKTEMFYNRSWKGVSIDEFIRCLDDYMNWYCRDRIKSTLGGLSPLNYRRRLGVGV